MQSDHHEGPTWKSNPGRRAWRGIEGIEGIDLPSTAYADRSAYIRRVRRGLPGDVVRQAVHVLGHRNTFVRLLGTTTGNLNRLYRRDTLGRGQSEALLDMLRLVSRAVSMFGDLDHAREWLDVALPAVAGERPIDLCDTFEGRLWVREALRKIEYGEFP